MTDRNGDNRREWIWLAGAMLWAVVWAMKWPAALSFGDEVGYVGQIRILLQGRLRPLPTDPGVWLPTAHGMVAKYPYFAPLLEAPLFAIHPRLIFITGPLACLALTFVASRALKAWGQSTGWALVMLVHPLMTILARTAMTDLVLTALVVGTWWAARRERVAWSAVLAAAATLTKVNGLLIVGSLLAGEIWRERRPLRNRERAAVRRILWLVGGLVAGIAGTIALNLAANGTPGSAYDDALRSRGAPSFSPRYLLTTGPVYLMTLLVAPPLLAAGAYGLWKRREVGPLLVIAGLIAMMGAYYFVDQGRSFAETVLVSPRLILPAVAFLLIGYADLLAIAWRRITGNGRAPAVLVVLPGLLALPVCWRHAAWQAQDAKAVAAASEAARGDNEGVLGLTTTSAKSGMLFRGRTVEVAAGPRPKIVLCSTRYPSYRDPNDPGGAYDCSFAGYDAVRVIGNTLVLRRKEP